MNFKVSGSHILKQQNELKTPEYAFFLLDCNSKQQTVGNFRDQKSFLSQGSLVRDPMAKL